MLFWVADISRDEGDSLILPRRESWEAIWVPGQRMARGIAKELMVLLDPSFKYRGRDYR